MTRKIALPLAALAVAAVLVGCAPTNEPVTVDLQDGRKVMCVDGYRSLSCDWGNAQ